MLATSKPFTRLQPVRPILSAAHLISSIIAQVSHTEVIKRCVKKVKNRKTDIFSLHGRQLDEHSCVLQYILNPCRRSVFWKQDLHSRW